MEAMINIRTVSSFGVESSIYKKYENKLIEPERFLIRKGQISGLLFGVSQIVMFVVFAVVFYIGSLFVRDYGVKFVDLFTAIFGIVFAAMTTGNNSQFMPDVASSKNSAANLFEILDSQDEWQMQEEEKSKMLTKGGTQGKIEVRNVTFKYPSRSNYTFRNLSFNIEPGTKVALVGSSGCGKSTIMQMLLRFY